jgi:hypothetical protein
MTNFQILPWSECSPKKGTPGEFVLFHDNSTVNAEYFARPRSIRHRAPFTTTVTIVQRDYPTGRLRKIGYAECKLTVTGTGWEWQAPILGRLMAGLNDGTLQIGAIPVSVGRGLRAWLPLQAIIEQAIQV